MAKYQVANIKFEFNYLFDKYFRNNIEAYQIDSNVRVDHSIKVVLNSNLVKPTGEAKGYKNPYTIINGNQKIICYHKKGIVDILITHDLDYKNVLIEIDPTKVKDLVLTEYIMSGIMFLELAMHRGYLPIHATALAINDSAILFSAPSGTGKSTHARYWKKAFPDTIIINDDKPFVNIENNELFVYGSPFSGEHKVNTNQKSKLKAFCFLKQGLNNKIEKVNEKEILTELIRNTFFPKLKDSWEKVLPIIEKLISEIPVIMLYATNSIDSVYTIYDYLFK